MNISDAIHPVEPGALHKLSYGLFILSAREGQKDNACVINTAIQVTDNPKRMVIAVNKGNYTNGMIARTGVFNLSVLTQEAPFTLFERFGFQSGRDTDKFAGYTALARTANGLYCLTEASNAVLSLRTFETLDCGSHVLFAADVTEARVLSGAPSATYAYYFEHIKPKPQAKKKGYVCRVCGYVYEGDPLPEDFICPVCKHGADAFDPIAQ